MLLANLELQNPCHGFQFK